MGVEGKLYLHSMPGRYEPIEDVWQAVRRLGIKAIVCLTPFDEISEKSPAYAAAMEAGRVPCDLRQLPVGDFQGPDDEDAFRRLAVDVADLLRRGRAVLVHCGAGIGRTGMFAAAALMALGLPRAEAARAVRSAGSEPGAGVQEDVLRRLEASLSSPKRSGTGR